MSFEKKTTYYAYYASSIAQSDACSQKWTVDLNCFDQTLALRARGRRLSEGKARLAKI